MKRILFAAIIALSCLQAQSQEVLDLNLLSTGEKKSEESSPVDSVSVISAAAPSVADTVVAPAPEKNAAEAERSRTAGGRNDRTSFYRDVAVTNSRLALSTNVFDWCYFLTPNVGVQYAVAQHWTLLAEAKYNRWAFRNDSPDGRLRQARQEYSLGFRWWDWYTYSGLWAGGRLMYREYSGNGPLCHSFADWGNRYLKEEGDAFALAASIGYSFQIKRWLDIDLGVGILGGYTLYRQYSGEADGTGAVCPRYGRRIDAPVFKPASGEFFIGPAEVVISVTFIL